MSYQFKNISVLLVDSEPAMRDMLKGVLGMFGVKTILACHDGASGLRAFREEKPDLVIVDWDLDSINGVEFTKLLRRDEANPYTPLIFMTALTSTRRVAEARDAGATEVLRKPFTARTLYQRIEAIVERPRPFVHSTVFVGPDRRRRGDGPAYDGSDRREKWYI